MEEIHSPWKAPRRRVPTSCGIRTTSPPLSAPKKTFRLLRLLAINPREFGDRVRAIAEVQFRPTLTAVVRAEIKCDLIGVAGYPYRRSCCRIRCCHRRGRRRVVIRAAAK